MENKDYGRDEIDLVHSMWIDDTQDTEVISSETGIEEGRVLAILKMLSSQGKIKGFNTEEKEIMSFNEMIDLDDYFSLDLHKLSTPKNDKDYFFDFEEVNKKFKEGPFEIEVLSKKNFHDSVVLDMDIIYKNRVYPICLIYNILEEIHFSSLGPVDSLDNFYNNIGQDKGLFFKITGDVLDKIIPYDFWETNSKFN